VTEAAWPCLGERGGGSLLRVAVVPPVEGQANARLLAWLADELGCARRAVRLQRGEASRRKAVEIDLPATAVAAWLARVLAPDAP
jgi:hypothetical protein